MALLQCRRQTTYRMFNDMAAAGARQAKPGVADEAGRAASTGMGGRVAESASRWEARVAPQTQAAGSLAAVSESEASTAGNGAAGVAAEAPATSAREGEEQGGWNNDEFDEDVDLFRRSAGEEAFCG